MLNILTGIDLKEMNILLPYNLDLRQYKVHLNGQPPCCLHGDGDETGDCISQGQVEDKVVNIGPASDGRPGGVLASCHQGDGVQ